MWLLKDGSTEPPEREWMSLGESSGEGLHFSNFWDCGGWGDYNFSIEKKIMMFYPEYFVTESTFFNGFYHTSFVEGIKGVNQGYAMCFALNSYSTGYLEWVWEASLFTCIFLYFYCYNKYVLLSYSEVIEILNIQI